MSDFIDRAREDVIRQIAEGESASEILQRLCLAFEANVAGAKAGVTILDRSLGTFESAAFPSLAPSYAEALKGIAVSDKPGSCALAVFEGRTVVSTDVATDSRFAAAWRNLGVEHGLEALVSIPVCDSQKRAIGTFVVAYPPKAGLSRAELQTADAFAQLCGLVMEREREAPGSRAAAADPSYAGSVQ